MRIRRGHLTVLLNRLYDRGDERFTVSHPATEVGDLLTVELDDPGECTIRFSTRRDAYRSALEEIRRTHPKEVADDFPSPREYVMAAMASGVVPIDNFEDVRAFVDRYGDPDLMAGHPPVFAGFDANLIPWRIDRILGLHDPDEGVGYVNGFVLATGVRDELDWDVKCHDVSPYVDAFGDEFEEYWNQPVGSGRKSRMALVAYREIRDIQQAIEIDCERGDEAIVEAYDAWQADSRGDVVLFSNDRTFVERATGHTILAQHVAVPDDLPRTTTASWGEVGTLLYVLTLLFGILELPGATVHGVWRGKDGLDWQRERLMLDCRSPALQADLETDLSIVETYEELRTE